MIKQLLVVISCFAFVYFCGQSNKHEISSVNNDSLKLDGYWVLTNYIDAINESKSIAPQAKNTLTWNAIVLKIEKDSIEMHGLIMNSKTALSENIDSCAIITEKSRYKLTLNQAESLIYAIDLNGEDTVKYKFRKINNDEENLVRNIDDQPFYKQLSLNFYNYFIETIIAGEYRSLSKSKNISTLQLLPNGKMSGFKKFDEFAIHDYFGTLHLFSSDVIIFTDTKKKIKENQPPNNSEAYKWEFIKDTLILTEYVTKDFENYKLGSKQYKFIKQYKKLI